jgi:hypothetical protein
MLIGMIGDDQLGRPRKEVVVIFLKVFYQLFVKE